MKLRLMTVVFLLLLVGAVTAPTTQPSAPHEFRTVEGFPVWVSKELLTQDPALAEQTLRLLQVKLFDVGRAIPAAALERLRSTPIWVELNDKDFPCMCYHPSAGWLKGHGHDPAKAGAVEISNAKTFLAWTHEQPYMVLHELAHAYHHKVIGYDNAVVHSAYEHAKAGGKYESVEHYNGRKVRHYALNNDQEYFAEATEAYFGTNDFYPFVRAELKEHDPEIFNAMHDLWSGKTSKKPAND